MTAHCNFPRALAGNVFAAGDTSPEVLFRQLQNAVDGHVRGQTAQIENLEAALQAMQNQMNGGLIGSSAFNVAADPEYTRAFASYFRQGNGEDALKQANAIGDRSTVHAAMSVGSASDGGYLAPVEWDRRLLERQRATSPMRRLASVQTTTVGAYTTMWNTDQSGSGWVGETAARPATTTPSLAPITFAAGEIYAMPAATQRVLDDAAINVDGWLIENIEREFNRQEGVAFLSGDGVNKPSGLLTFATDGTNAALHPGGAVTVTTAAISFDTLSDFLYSLDAPYRQNATWLMSSLTAATIAKLKDSTGRPLWRESIMVGQPNTLLGIPVEIDEGMPAPTSGNIAIALGDFKAGYLINDRIGTRVLRDPFTNKPYVMFYVTKRVGAGLLNPFAFRFLKIT